MKETGVAGNKPNKANRNLTLLDNLSAFSKNVPAKIISGTKRSLKELTLLAIQQEDELRRTKELRNSLKEHDRLTFRVKYGLQLYDCLQNACKHHKPSKLKKCTFKMSELVDIIYTQYSQFISLLIIDDRIKSEVKCMIRLLCDHVPEFISIENCGYLFEEGPDQSANSNRHNEYVHINLNCNLGEARKKLADLATRLAVEGEHLSAGTAIQESNAATETDDDRPPSTQQDEHI